jgi:predicted GIY-YIG superfamily endonuclease
MNYLYVIYCENPHSVKIGVSGNIPKRLSSLQTSNPTKLKLLGFVEHENAYQLEQDIHAYLKDYKINGEWFRFEGLASLFVELIKTNRILHLELELYSSSWIVPSILERACA